VRYAPCTFVPDDARMPGGELGAECRTEAHQGAGPQRAANSTKASLEAWIVVTEVGCPSLFSWTLHGTATSTSLRRGRAIQRLPGAAREAKVVHAAGVQEGGMVRQDRKSSVAMNQSFDDRRGGRNFLAARP
jgi:hypothetical protein